MKDNADAVSGYVQRKLRLFWALLLSYNRNVERFVSTAYAMTKGNDR
jgi:hypothetical protein